MLDEMSILRCKVDFSSIVDAAPSAKSMPSQTWIITVIHPPSYSMLSSSFTVLPPLPLTLRLPIIKISRQYDQKHIYVSNQ
jgi:hypothetical protein